MTTGNRGEWSEFYTFIKLLSERRLNVADENLNKVPDTFFPILHIVRNERDGICTYGFEGEEKIKLLSRGSEVIMVDGSDLKEKTLKILEEIKNSQTTTFSIPVADELMERFRIKELKAGNSRKEDLTLKIQDRTNHADPEIGFSIKSMLGGPATLLNASSATNFIYEVTGLDQGVINEINSIDSRSKVRDRLARIDDLGGKLHYSGMQSEIFSKNLQKIELLLPEIISHLLTAYYHGNASTMAELSSYMGESKISVSSFNLDESDYKLKIKNLLHNVALGMVPNTEWDGTLHAHGGYIVVREDGEVLSYSTYNIDELRSYLFRNTKLETPSTGRHDYGYLYVEGNRIFIKLNLQIRFFH